MENCIISFVETIKYFIAENNMTITSFSRELKVKDVCVARWISGVNTPSLEYVILVADFFNFSVDYLLGLKDEPSFSRSLTSPSFSQRLTLLLDSSRISMNNLAKICKVTSSNVSKWIRGQMPKPHIICLLSEYFVCSADFLLGRSDQK